MRTTSSEAPSRPVSDVVSTLTAGVDARTRARRIGITATGTADWVHYASLVTERGANVATTLRFDFLLNRFTPYVGGSYQNRAEAEP